MEAYEDKGLTRQVGLLKQMVQPKLWDCEAMPQYVNSLAMTAFKVSNAGLKIDEELTASFMLAGLLNEFQAILVAVENSK